jgi:tetratricopeptide (TPR) repeat protein
MLSWYVQMRPEAALEMARAMGPFWRANGQFSEARAWLRSILAHSTSPTVSRGEALLHAADFARHQGDLAESIALYDEACALFKANNDEHGLCMALCQQAWAYYDTNCNQAEAQAALERALSIARRIGDKAGTVEALGALAHMRMAGAATNAARDAIAAMLEEALACARDLNDAHKLGFLLQQFATLHLTRGQVREARADFEQAAEAFRRTGDVFSVAWSLSGEGECAMRLGDLAGARRCFEQGMRTFESSGGREGVLILTHHLAHLDLLQGRLSEAAAGFHRCIALCDASDYPQMRARCIAGLGGAAVRAGHIALGARLLAAAQQQFDALPPFLLPPDQAEYEQFAGEAKSLLGDAAFMVAWEAGMQARQDELLCQAAGMAHPSGR